MSRRRRRSRRGNGGAPFSLFSFQDIMAAVTGVMIVTTLLLVIDLLTRMVARGSAEAASASAGATAPSFDAEALIAALRAEAAVELISSESIDALSAQAAALQARVTESRAAQRLMASEEARASASASAGREQLAWLAEVIAEVRRRIDLARRRPPVTLLEGQAAGRPTWWVRLDGDRVTAGVLAAAGEAMADEAVSSWPSVAEFLAAAGALSPDERGWVLLVTPRGVADFTVAQEALRRAGFDVGWDLAPAGLPESSEAAR